MLAKIFNEESKKYKNNKDVNKISRKANELLNKLNNIDFTTDKANESIYYALSAFFSIGIILSNLPLVPKVISRATYIHANTKVLPKYRKRLMRIYSNKIKDLNNEIDELKNTLDDDNRGDVMMKIENLESTRDKFINDYKQLRVV